MLGPCLYCHSSAEVKDKVAQATRRTDRSLLLDSLSIQSKLLEASVRGFSRIASNSGSSLGERRCMLIVSYAYTFYLCITESCISLDSPLGSGSQPMHDASNKDILVKKISRLHKVHISKIKHIRSLHAWSIHNCTVMTSCSARDGCMHDCLLLHMFDLYMIALKWQTVFDWFTHAWLLELGSRCKNNC